MAIVLRTSYVCIASSRVGDKTTAAVESWFVHRSVQSFSNKGIRNASVFPLPVFAAAKISLPRRAVNKVARWIAVGEAFSDSGKYRRIPRKVFERSVHFHFPERPQTWTTRSGLIHGTRIPT